MSYYPLISIMPKGSAFDPDAQAFITAAGITNPTQQGAINTLVTDLKGYSLWTKFKAIYPIVGGTAASHKWNLKDPRDLDAAFRLNFATGWTHSANGMTPNGATFANTFLIPSSQLSLNSTHISGYIRTNSVSQAPILSSENAGSYDNGLYIWPLQNQGYYSVRINDNTSTFATVTYDIRGLHLATRTASNVKKYRVNTTQIFNDTTGSTALNTSSIYIGASRNNANYFNNQIAFNSIGDGLTDTEAANFYTAVQAFQTTLGRSIGTQTVSDADAQAFVTAANIVDQVQATAINNLVIELKADSLWTKMKAIYPVVGGSASSHAVNLKTPGTFNLSFSSGWTHSANGMQPNGAAYADTNFSISGQMTASNAAFGIYSRTNDTTGLKVIGAYNGANVSRCWINLTNGNIQIADTGQISYTANPSTGFFMSRRDATNFNQSYKNGVSLGSVTNNFSVFNLNFYLGAANDGGSPNYYSTHQMAFAFLGGNAALTDTDAANLNTRVNTYQTALSRNI
jgi:hypothetical protein